MIKGIAITIFVLIGIFDILLIVGCLRLEKKQDEYEAYERWKEERMRGTDERSRR